MLAVLLLSIALLDSLSMLPLAIGPLVLSLGERRSLLLTSAFIFGIALAYFLVGLAILFGMNALVESLRPTLERWWQDPDAAELVVQLVIGLALLVLVWRRGWKSDDEGLPERNVDTSVASMFMLGAFLSLAGLPGAVPYFGAIDQILRADLDQVSSLLALLAYNLFFVSPLLLVTLLGTFSRKLSQPIVDFVSTRVQKYGSRAIALAMGVLGIAFVGDAFSWFIGHPITPIG